MTMAARSVNTLPSALKGKRHMPIIDEDCNPELALTGSIEVEAVESAAGEPVFNRILYLPLDFVNEFELGLDPSHSHDEEKEEEGYELPESILDALTSNFMNSCGACEQFYPKSALRRPTGSRAVPQEHPVADRTVSFSSLDIREFNMTLGNHPSATSGPPVMLDSVASERTVDLDEYEHNRGPRRKRRQLKLSYKERKAYLTNECGYSTMEIQKEWAEALEIRKQRQETLNRGILLMAFDDVYESACRKMNRATSVLRLH